MVQLHKPYADNQLRLRVYIYFKYFIFEVIKLNCKIYIYMIFNILMVNLKILNCNLCSSVSEEHHNGRSRCLLLFTQCYKKIIRRDRTTFVRSSIFIDKLIVLQSG